MEKRCRGSRYKLRGMGAEGAVAVSLFTDATQIFCRKVVGACQLSSAESGQRLIAGTGR